MGGITGMNEAPPKGPQFPQSLNNQKLKSDLNILGRTNRPHPVNVSPLNLKKCINRSPGHIVPSPIRYRPRNSAHPKYRGEEDSVGSWLLDRVIVVGVFLTFWSRRLRPRDVDNISDLVNHVITLGRLPTAVNV
jgi:hypothetical protein